MSAKGKRMVALTDEEYALVKSFRENRKPAKEIPYNPAWTHGQIGADEEALMLADGWRMRPNGSYFKPGS